MSETPPLDLLPNNHPRRVAVAKQLVRARAIDNGESLETYRDDRSGRAYVAGLLGLSATLHYINTHCRNKMVLDIGVGFFGQGIDDLSRSELFRGLLVRGTALSFNELRDNYLGNDKVFITSAEYLNPAKIADESVSLVLGLRSFSYTADPTAVVGSIDRVLERNGAVKGAFLGRDGSTRLDEHRSGPFAAEFRRRGYSVSVVRPKTTVNGVEGYYTEVLEAIKPGAESTAGEDMITARSLIEADYAALPVDLQKFPSTT